MLDPHFSPDESRIGRSRGARDVTADLKALHDEIADAHPPGGRENGHPS
jgi:hypothetical protein